jgi:hypothetical protein
VSTDKTSHSNDTEPNPRGFGWRLEVHDLDLFVIGTKDDFFRPLVLGISDELSKRIIDSVPISDENSVIETLRKLVERIGAPSRLRCPDVPEFRSETFLRWAESGRIPVQYITKAELATELFRERSKHWFRSIRSSPRRVN